MLRAVFLFVVIYTTLSVSLFSQEDISWRLDIETNILTFNKASNVDLLSPPKFAKQFDIQNNEELIPVVNILEEKKLTESEKKARNINPFEFTETISTEIFYPSIRKDKKAVIAFTPIFKRGNDIYVATKFEINYSKRTVNAFANRSSRFSSNSVLSNGTFHKLSTTKDGVYKVTYSQLKDFGILSSSVSANSINIYGNHNGMLPEQNSAFRYDDLEKNAISVIDGGDGSFDDGDYILFFAMSPHKWKLNTSNNQFYYEQHLYDTKSYYFITTDDLSGAKRINTINSSASAVTHNVSTFNDFAAREIEKYNMMEENKRGGSGKLWYGELFDVQLSYNFNFSFPNIDATSPVNVKTVVIANTPGSDNSYFTINAGSATDNLVIPGIPLSQHPNLGITATSSLSFNSSNNNIPVGITFTKAASGNSQGWLDYIEVNARRQLDFYGNQLMFRDVNSVGTSNIAEFSLTNGLNVHEIWDITDPLNAKKLATNVSGNTHTFTFEADSLRTFIAFQNSGYLNVNYEGSVTNQNLHGQPVSDMIIVYHPNFKSQVDKLEAFHNSKGLSVVKATVQEIYNEFSSGMQDVAAIKTYAKMLYDKGGSNPPKYLLLFGDGSFDYLGRVSPNHNFVPVWESAASLNDLTSYTSDDFYGILDDGEGMSDYDLMDVAVGRLTVKTASEAEIVVDKIINYQKEGVSLTETHNCNTGSEGNSYGDWRNILTFVSDDVDANWEMSFFRHTEKVIDSIKSNYPVFNIEKFHMDAYKQQSTPGGERYLVGAEDFKRRVENGTLIVAYEGHGGEVGWAHERILDLSTINGWTNYNKLPVFLTATCEFTKYDDPARVSAGEQLFLNSRGGSIALFTTTRAVFQSANERLIEGFFEEAFIKKSDGSPRTLGDIYMETKNHSGVIGNNNARKFALIGDPALDLAFPKHQVFTETVNGNPITGPIDTLKALSKVTITGRVADESGNTITSFNGFVYPTVYDKAKVYSTLGNYSPAYIANFLLQNSVLYKGKATVTNGLFSYSFIVPKDIDYTFGSGKLSYYAFNGQDDAAGSNQVITIGGTNTNALQDQEGPQVDLFLNNKSFVSGGITDEDPTIYAEIFDSNGINTTGNGIGHDITAVIDENTNQAIVLNNYYESDADTYQSGKINYPLSSLSDGNHTLSLKAWDVYNNSSKTTIDFVVVKNENLAIDHVLNYPNPFTTRTQFFFEHNQNCEFLDAQVQVFTISGKLVKTINQRVQTHGYRVDPIEWNGRDDYGDKIGKGTYVYKVKVVDDQGNHVEKFEKLVILN